jgi:predicted exporter
MDRLREVVDRHRAEMKADGLRVGFGGSYPVLLAEYRAITEDALLSFSLVMAIILSSLLLFFREIRPALAIGGAVLVAIAVTFGLTWCVIGYLNTQTAFLGSIVAGNGLNYALVYLVRVSQLRRGGASLERSCQEGAQAAYRGTLLAAMGTSAAFGTLLIATNRGFRHFGFLGGVGILLCWASTFALVPAMLALFDRVRPYRAGPPRERAATAARLLGRFFAHPRAIALGFGVLTAAAVLVFVWRLPSALERNLDNLTNDELGSAQMRRDNRRGQAALGESIAGAVALLPSREAAEKYCDAIERRKEGDPRLAAVVQSCETVDSVVPPHQEEKLQILDEIRQRLTGDLLGRLPPAQEERARRIRQQLGAQRRLREEDAPPELLDRFRERDGTVGRLAFVRARPDARLEYGPNLRTYAAGVRDVPVEVVGPDGQTRVEHFDAAGTNIVAADLLANIERQGPRVTLLSLFAVWLLVIVFFRSWVRSAILIASLTAGVALMAGLATVAGLKINFFNFVVFPITFGIGVDYGANLLSRMAIRRNVVPALVEVGPAVILCSWTTIVGYGSLVLSFNRALRSFGWYAMLGELTTLLTALVLLPSLARLVKARAAR